MQRAIEAIKAVDVRAAEATETITLIRADRYRRRVALETDGGDAFLLDLPEPTYLAHGDGLLLDSGGVIGVRAAAEPLLKIEAVSPMALNKITWHIGNRHTPCEITDTALYIQPDHVLADMVRGLGGTVSDVSRPFEPEGGAYGGHGGLSKGHHHHAHDHDDEQHHHNHTHHG